MVLLQVPGAVVFNGHLTEPVISVALLQLQFHAITQNTEYRVEDITLIHETLIHERITEIDRLASPTGDSQEVAIPCCTEANGVEFKPLRSLLKSVREEAERNAIVQTLERTRWNRKAAARLLKVSYRTILYKIQQYELSSTSNSSSAD